MSTTAKVRVVVARVEGTPLPPDSPSHGAKRNIPKGHDFDAKALRPLSRALFSASVSLGHAVTAYKEFARIKSSSVSPDGMMGGRGYVMPVKDIRAQLQQACEILSAVTDTLHDEINAPHWKPRMADLSPNEAEDVTELVEEAEQAISDPEGVGEGVIKRIEQRNDGEDSASKLPETGGPETSGAKPYSPTIDKQASWKSANSSLPVTTLPGPRVDHLDRGEQTGPGGSYNQDELPVDGWGQGPREYDYVSVWDNELTASTSLPSDDETETEARDFGVGYGARGRGTEGYGTVSPDGRGVSGPSSGLPSDPGGRVRDPDEGATPYMDGIERNLWAGSGLPDTGPVSRSDYYPGDKGNQLNVSLRAESGLPGDSGSPYNFDRGTPNTGQNFERQDVPYVKFDWTTHNYRNDLQDIYRYDKVGTNG